MSEVRRLGDRYEVGELLGRGGMAEVHEGRDLRLGRRVAIKILKPELAADPSFLARFRREAQSAAALNHPHIVAVYDTGEDILGEAPRATTVPFIVMELVEGITLKEVLASGNPLVPERVLQITSEILAALDYSHRHGIIHRDIKPANVMLTASAGSVKVMDFGIARATADPSQTLTSTATVMGTAAYLSPEQAQGLSVDARSDLYSTGVVLFELLTHRPPFVGEAAIAVAYAHVNEPAPVPSSVDPTVPRSLDVVVAKALQKDRTQRYQTALEFRADVERAIAGVPVTQVLAPGVAAGDETAVLSAAQDQTVALGAATGPMPPVIPGGAGTSTAPAPGSDTPPPAKKKVWGKVGLAAVVLGLVGLMGWLAVTLLASTARTVAVPNLSGLTVDQAQRSLQDSGLTLGREDVQASDKPENTIIDQDPSRGEMVAEGTRVNVVISVGKEQVQVPDLVDYRSIDDVRSALSDAGLTLGQVREESSDQPQETVLRQDPQAYTMVDSGSAVSIWVSNAQVEVPDVVGRSDADARDILFAQGFEVAYGAEVETGSVSPGTVVRQSPAGGRTATKGSQVTLSLAREPEPTPTPTPTPTPDATETSAADGGGADGAGGPGGANVDGDTQNAEANPGLSAPPSP